ncbi:MAG: bifunctional DNA-formamidopyrimidine glycosylase/DNA-(apurinic or apyrimidinic site) lyase [Dehalococcoidia bacterium]
MPELPDVETIKNELSPHVIGHQFIEVEIFQERAIQELSAQEFSRRLIGQRIEDIGRRGKYMLFRLSGKETLIIHLRMTGVLLLEPSPQPYEHTTAIFRLDGGVNIHFIDQRKLGWLWLVEDENTVIGKLGPEPLESSFTAGTLHNIVKKRNIPIKAVLLDQHAIAGVGNMYADEALFYARIHPLRRANTLSDEEIELLHEGIVEVLKRGIRNQGATVDTYRLPNGQRGRAQTEFNVAHRRGESCYVCGSAIDWVKITGRGSCFCPVCQSNDTM